MAIVKYCIIRTTSPVGRCDYVVDWDDSATYYPPTDYVIAGDNTGGIGDTYDSGTSPGGTWTGSSASAVGAGTASTSYGGSGTGVYAQDALPIENGGTGASDAYNAAFNLGFFGKHTIWVPASAMTPRTTNGAASGSVETATNKVMLKTLDFDAAAAEYVQFAIQMPASWSTDAGLVVQFIWSHAATTTNFGVAWECAAVALADAQAADAAFGTAITVTDTGGATNTLYITDESSVMTPSDIDANEEYLVFQINRAPSNASDTMAIDARLHGVKIHYTIFDVVDG
jgi:hypothetical protein